MSDEFQKPVNCPKCKKYGTLEECRANPYLLMKIKHKDSFENNVEYTDNAHYLLLELFSTPKLMENKNFGREMECMRTQIPQVSAHRRQGDMIFP